MIKFGTWAPDRDTFILSWIEAGIWDYDAEARLQYLPPYAGGMDTNMDSWPGVVTKTKLVVGPQTLDDIPAAVQQHWIDEGVTELVDGALHYTTAYGSAPVMQEGGALTPFPQALIDAGYVTDGLGGIAIPPLAVAGWHTNVRVYGEALIAQFTAGLEQYNTAEDGTRTLKSVWDRTHAAAVFGLQYKEADPSTGFPSGYTNGQVVYADITDFSSPANVF